MSTTDREDERAHLERINAELNESLERCRDLLKTHRSQLAANSNEPNADNGEEDERSA
jgi:nitrate/nitrite-specific signal transduction histidine kinase